MTDKTLYIVHCMDVEGPMTETLEATWERVFAEDGIWMNVAPTRENLRRLQEGTLDLPVDEEVARRLAGKFCPANLAYLTSWEEIDRSILPVVSQEGRRKYADMTGGGYRFSWFIYDHYGFTTNPRFHDVGIHRIFDHYQKLFLADDPAGDGVYWHYHHVPASGDALEWNTSWSTNGIHEEILARRVIEREWFPSIFRAGGHIERNDLSHWLEMFIPFDFSCRTPHGVDEETRPGTVNDWRRAPKEWGCYHPDWYDYRRPGEMKRWLFRCLDLKTWIRSLEARDVGEAFQQARERGVSVLAYYNHDYRDMEPEVAYGHGLVSQMAREYPDVTWKYANALDAARVLTGGADEQPGLGFELEGSRLTITSERAIFGPQPFLAIQENGNFFRDNTTREGEREWVYQFRKPRDVEAFGVAASSPQGEVEVKVSRGRLQL